MKNSFILLLGSAVLLLGSCDKVEGPYGEKPVVKPGELLTADTFQSVRRIYIEDFTGHTCGNCPEAAQILEQINDIYKSQVVSAGVHTGFFADPAGSKYKADYRTTEGAQLGAEYGIGAEMPKGLINRNTFSGKTVLERNEWASKAALMLAEAPEASMIIRPRFEADSRNLSVDLHTKLLTDFDEQLNYILYLVEDSIQSSQKDYSIPEGERPNYWHRHVLRGSMNGTWGTKLADKGAFSEGEIISNQQTINIPDNWNAQQTWVIALLVRASDKVVIQAETKRITDK